MKQKLEIACRAAAQSEIYQRVTKAVHQPNDYYAGSAEFQQALESDLADKTRLLGQLGMVKN